MAYQIYLDREEGLAGISSSEVTISHDLTKKEREVLEGHNYQVQEMVDGMCREIKRKKKLISKLRAL